ncbi:protein tramtrack, alpha isoform-like [Tigriopus californicus]|uniref:protein tramtrack, alpha isoform-like n=1 Tax=Tigriopus californicus TaxID=6832 RepID=UPI0027DA349F|nr:protein tramtrack, alpha isoform-like [Tigriopus californicus]
MEEEYMLKWRDYQSNFFSLAEELYLNEFLTDVTLCCKNQYFEAHRLVLSVCSPYFHSLFTQAYHSHPLKHPIIFLKDVKPLEMERLLQFIYYGEVKVPNSEIEAFIQAASSLNIRGLSSLQKPRRDSEGATSTAAAAAAATTRTATTPASANPTPIRDEQQQQPQTTPSPHASTSRHTMPLADYNKSSPLKKRKRRHSYFQNTIASPPPLENKDIPAPHHPTSHYSIPLVREQKQEKSLNLSTKRSPNRDEEPDSKPNSISGMDPLDEQQSRVISLKREDEHCRLNDGEEEERGVSPPPSQYESVTIIPDLQSTSANALYRASSNSNRPAATPRILPPNEPRKSGTCYFCKKAFMKNKQLMNHVCPKKPKAVNPGSTSPVTGGK